MLITIHRRIPSQNATQYSHWRKYTTERDAWAVLLRSHLVPRTPPDHRVRVSIHSYRTRYLDYGNLVGGAKPIPDVIVRLGWARDDSPRWMDTAYAQTVVPKEEERTEISIEPAP